MKELNNPPKFVPVGESKSTEIFDDITIGNSVVTTIHASDTQEAVERLKRLYFNSNKLK